MGLKHVLSVSLSELHFFVNFVATKDKVVKLIINVNFVIENKQKY